MSGIAGIVDWRGGPLGPAAVAPVLDRLRRLGPDGEGVWCGPVGRGTAVLAVARRRRTPEDDADTQPVVVAEGRVVVVADVVLDNRAELCRLLGLRDATDTADAAIVAAAYLRWGEACAGRLLGDVAAAVVDRRQGRVVLVRDHLGTRPLHVHHGGGRLCFASTALAVAAGPGVPAALDEERLRQYLGLMMASDRSWVRDVAVVPPGSTVTCTPGSVRPRRYWRLPTDVVAHGRFEDHVAELRAALDGAVADRARRRRGHLGATVSGGLDSTAVAATAAVLLAPEPVRTYTSVPPRGWSGPVVWGRDADEGPLVRALAARHPNLRPAFLDVRGQSLFAFHEDLYARGGTPPLNPCNHTWFHVISREAAADGVGLLLGGDLGNLAFSADDPRWLVQLLARGHGVETLREARAWARATGQPLRAVLRRSVLREVVPVPVLTWRARRRPAGGAPLVDLLEASASLRPGLVAGLDLDRHRAFGDERRTRALRAFGPHNLELWSPYAETLAAESARWELRRSDPTSDVRVLELAARQPGWFRRHRGRDRAAARAAMAGRVPDAIRLRTERGAQLPDWADRLADAREELADELDRLRDHPPSRRLVDVERLDALMARGVRPADSGEVRRMTDYRAALLRALVASRYARWLERELQAAPAHPASIGANPTSGERAQRASGRGSAPAE